MISPMTEREKKAVIAILCAVAIYCTIPLYLAGRTLSTPCTVINMAGVPFPPLSWLEGK